MIILRDKSFSYVPYEKQEEDKKQRRKLLAGGLALSGAGSVAGYKKEVALGDKKIDKKIGSKVSKFNKKVESRESNEIGKATRNFNNNLRNIENNRVKEIEKANKSLFFKGRKIKKANIKATDLVNKEAQNLEATTRKAKSIAANNKARYGKVAEKVAAKSKKLLRTNASNRALRAAFVGTGITLGAVHALKQKQKRDNKEKYYSFLGDLGNKIADSILKGDRGLGKLSDNIEEGYKKYTLFDDFIFSRLEDLATSYDIKVEMISTGNSRYVEIGNTKIIKLSSRDCMAFAHELGHGIVRHEFPKKYKKLIEWSNKNHKILNDKKKYIVSKNILGSNFVKTGDVNIGKAINNLAKSIAVSNINAFEELEASLVGGWILGHIANPKVLKDYGKKFSISWATYLLGGTSRDLTMLSELIRPEDSRTTL